jgi:23S rRNA (guanosine2251-2'-O)-methyltransferase
MSRLVYGLRPVEELLRSRRPVSAVYHAEGDPSAALRPILDAARAARVTIEERPRPELDALAEGKLHQGVIAVAGDYVYAELDELLAAPLARGASPLLLVLDGVQDPQNLGALVRSAHVLGADGVVIPRDRAAQVTPAVVKASAGATEHTRVARVTNLARTLEELKERGVWTVGAAVEGGEPPWAIDLAQPTALVLGSEGKGLRPRELRSCDHRVCIPMAGRVASLNVSVAGAILLYEAHRQRAAAQR